jgi:superfamily II DNA or RNA helicase
MYESSVCGSLQPPPHPQVGFLGLNAIGEAYHLRAERAVGDPDHSTDLGRIITMTNTIRAVLDNEIRISRDDMRPEWWEAMQPLVSLPNREKEEAVKRRLYGASEMPDQIPLWYEDGGWIVLPRGIRDPLLNGFGALGVGVEWDDRRSSDRMPQVWPPFPLRPQQGPAARRLLEAQEGIYEAPAGSGKTVAGLELVRIARQRRNIVIVNEVGIARQWLEEGHDFLGEYGYGMIGGGTWSEGRLTLATLQTLYSRIDVLPPEWWAQWGVMILDECHHQTARTFIEVVSRFPSLIRVGLSATPDKTGDFDIAQAVLGDVVARTTRHELRDHGILVRPTVRVVDTRFQADYWPDHDATRKTGYVCMKPGCPKSGKVRHSHRNNYQKVLSALVEDRLRNDIIAARIKEFEGRRQIVVSKQTKQLHAIRAAMERAWVTADIIWLTGEVSEDDRVSARLQIEKNPNCVLLTTIADEAFNAPLLQVLHMPFPTKNLGAIRQRIGRVERAVRGKDWALVLDYRDGFGPFARHFSDRRYGVYAEELYKVEWESDEQEEAA